MSGVLSGREEVKGVPDTGWGSCAKAHDVLGEPDGSSSGTSLSLRFSIGKFLLHRPVLRIQ